MSSHFYNVMLQSTLSPDEFSVAPVIMKRCWLLSCRQLDSREREKQSASFQSTLCWLGLGSPIHVHDHATVPIQTIILGYNVPIIVLPHLSLSGKNQAMSKFNCHQRTEPLWLGNNSETYRYPSLIPSPLYTKSKNWSGRSYVESASLRNAIIEL